METVKLSKYLEDSTVGFVGSMSKLFVEDGVPLLRGQNILPFTLELTDPKFISSETHAKWKKSALSAGDVVLVRVGHPGTCCVIPEGMGELNAASLVILRTVKEKLDPYFLSIFFNSPEGRRQVDSLTVGSVQSVFNVKTAHAIDIPDFELPEQQRIVDLIKGINDKIELNQKMNQTLEDIAKAVFKSWFVDFDPVRAKAEGRPTGLPPEISDLFPDELVDSEIGEIPKGWRSCKIRSLVSLNTQSWSKKNHPDFVEYLDLGSIKSNHIIDTEQYDWDDAPSRAKRILTVGDTVVGTVRPGNRSFGYIQREGITGSTGFAVLTPLKKEYSEFVYLAACSDQNIDRLAHLADGGAYPAVSNEIILETTCINFSEELMLKFHTTVTSLLQKLEVAEQENIILSELRDTLLPKLISGELRIPDAEKFLEEAGI